MADNNLNYIRNLIDYFGIDTIFIKDKEREKKFLLIMKNGQKFLLSKKEHADLNLV